MRTFLAMALLAHNFLALAQQPPAKAPVTRAKPGQQSRASSTFPVQPMNYETAFFYYVAVHGAPQNVFERYASYFDSSNYQRSMADEFERTKYRTSIQSLITERVKNIDFERKFTLIGQGNLGEYSFSSHSFPVVGIPSYGPCLDAGRTSGVCSGTVLHVDVFRQDEAVNASEFTWSMEMSESDASAFIKSRSHAGHGSIDRRVAIRITYSIVNLKGRSEDRVFGHAAALRPLIHSVEVFADESLRRQLGTLHRTITAGRSTAEQWRAAAENAESSARLIGTYRYIASFIDNRFRRPDTPVVGTISLTDVSASLSGERPDGTTQPVVLGFRNAFAERRDYHKSHGYSGPPQMTLWRGDFGGGSKDNKEFLVIWDGKQLRFVNREERDRFFRDLTAALRAWSEQNPPFAVAQLKVDERCQNAGGWMRQCQEATSDSSSTSSARLDATEESNPSAGIGSASRSSSGGSATSVTPTRVPYKNWETANPSDLAQLTASIERGETVVFVVRKALDEVHLMGEIGSHEVLVSKTEIAFRPKGGTKIFSATPDRLLALSNDCIDGFRKAPCPATRRKDDDPPDEPTTYHIRVKVAVINSQGKEEKQKVDFYHPAAGSANGAHCVGCDASMDTLYALLQKVKGDA